MLRKRDDGSLLNTFFEVAKTHPKAGLWLAGTAGMGGSGLTWVWPKTASGFGFLIGWLLLACAAFALLGSVAGFMRHAGQRSKLRRQRKLQDIHDLTWSEFEQIVAAMYRCKRYVVQEVGGPGDGGIDLILRGHKECVAVQCKQWRNWKVGVGQIRDFCGAMADLPEADRGIFVTCGKYSDDCRAYAQRHRIELVDGDALLALIDDSLGRVVHRAEPPSVPMGTVPACPACGQSMKRRTAQRGQNAGQEFWGCSSYPKCRGTRPVEQVA